MFLLADGKPLPLKNKDHSLVANDRGHKEYHIEPDWLLIDKVDHDEKKIFFERTGTHADLF